MAQADHRSFSFAAAMLIAGAMLPNSAQAQTVPVKPYLDCTLILEAASGKTLHREGTCDKRFSPASTFKVPLAAIGYDAGILEDQHKPLWDYQPRFNAVARDRKPVDPTIWEADSVIWYSREMTARLGPRSFAAHVAKLGYGNGDVSGDRGQNNGLTHSWISSSLTISPEEQTGFLRRLLSGSLPVSGKAHEMTRAILPSFSAGDWTVKGKTGSIWLRNAAGEIDRKRPLGWFVGWADNKDRRVVFARLLIGAERTDGIPGRKLRDAFLKELPVLMKAK